MKKTTKKILTVLLLFIVLAAFSGCERIKAVYGKKDGTPGFGGAGFGMAAPVFAVAVMPAPQGLISDYLSLAGDVVAASTVDAYSDAAGKVSRLNVAVGTWVNSGDPIAEVDPSRPGMEFVTSVVKAPVSGTVVAMPAQLGMTVSQAVPIARITGGAGLEVRLNVAERFISRISQNQACDITLDAWPGEIFQGRVREISPVVDPSSRTMEVRIAVDNSGSRLKSGMFAKVKIITEQKDNVVKIPSTAMIQRFGEEYVFVAAADPQNSEQSIAVKRNVVPGILIDGILEVTQGLNPGDEVIVRGHTLLVDGSSVNVVERSNLLPN